MLEPVYRIEEWYKSVHIVGYFYYILYLLVLQFPCNPSLISLEFNDNVVYKEKKHVTENYARRMLFVYVVEWST
jgi:hypothetical protein